MKKIILLTSFIILGYIHLWAQNDLLKKANVLYEMNLFEEAIPVYFQYLRSQPDNKEAILKVAESYEMINDLEHAEQWYRSALAKNVLAENILKYGKVLMRQGKYEEAKQQFTIYASVDLEEGKNYARMCDDAYKKKDILSLYKVSLENINTEHTEFSPTFFKNQLVYGSFRKDVVRPDATTEEAQKENPTTNYLFQSNYDDKGVLGPPTYLRSWFRDNDKINEGPIAYSANGQWVAFTKNQYVNNVSTLAHHLYRSDIFIAKVLDNGDWEEVENFPFNSPSFSNTYPFLSSDGNTLYFASNREGGYGGFDIYKSIKNNGLWTEPKNLGNTINKKGDEITPYLVENDLYFSSDYLSGFGGQDVFKATFNPSKKTWTIMNLGTAINTSANDFGFIYNQDKNLGYLVSDRTGSEDIFKLMKSSTDISIQIIDALDKKAVSNVHLDFTKCGKGTYQTSENGQFALKASSGINCEVTLKKSGYHNQKFKINKDLAAQGNIEIKMYQVGQKYTGKIVDGNSNLPISNVRVRILNELTGAKTEEFSDKNGIYTIALKAHQKYMISFNKLGYVDYAEKHDTKDGTDKSILGSVLLFPRNAVVDGGTSPIPSPPPVIDPTPPMPPVPTPPTPTPPSPIPDGEIQKGYSIQLLSLSAGNNNFPDGIWSLKGLVEQVYTTTDQKWKRFRVGVYATKEEAEKIKKLVQNKGFAKAYIVEEDAKGVIQKVKM